MGFSLSLTQLLFFGISLLFSTAFSTHYFEGGVNGVNLAVGLLGGSVLGAFLYGLETVFKASNLRSFNAAALGLFFGFFIGSAIVYLLEAVIGAQMDAQSMMPVRFLIYLSSAYLGVQMVLKASEELRLCIPFLELKQIDQKKKDILVDLSILSDPRLIDLASTGLLDQHLLFPRFSLKELYAQAESPDEAVKTKARRSLEVLRKLESLPSLDLRYVETDFPEIKDPMLKLTQLARFLDTHIITSDINRVQQSSIEGIRIINIHTLSNALKPITQMGEVLNIKIQRYGKEARQGVGYLDDGTMVVVNGGAEFIGETVKASVLSVKHTSSGRMIFCNTADLQSEDFSLSGRFNDALRNEETAFNY